MSPSASRSSRSLVGAILVALSLLSAAASGSCGAGPEASPTTVDAPDGAAVLESDAAACTKPYPTPRNTPLSVLSTMPDVTFEGIDETGAPRAFALHDEYEPCAEKSRLLVVRISALWCGTCEWHWKHSQELLGGETAARLKTLDLLVANEDNIPAVVQDLARFRARIDHPGRVGIDDHNAFAPILDGTGGPLPLYVFLDTRTMKIVNYKSDPDPTTLAYTIANELAVLDKAPRPTPPKEELVDGLTRNQRDLLAEMKFPGPPPPDIGNAFGDDAKAAALGKQLFADPLLSPSGTISCATCHAAATGFSDGKAQSEGVSRVDRNSPTLLFAAYQRWQFWDGRADALWSQALGPFESEREFGGTRMHVVHQVVERYKAEYEAAFPTYPLPDVSNTARFPLTGKPGQPAWDGMSAADKEQASRVYVNVGKSIAAFERTLRAKPNRLDRYIEGDKAALTEPEKTGLVAFFQLGCVQCHFGPRLTNDAFHNSRFGTGRVDGAPDRGRGDVIAAPVEFSRASAFADAVGPGPLPPRPPGFDTTFAIGQFKTPTLRGLPQTAPYGHGGTLATIEDVAHHYGTRGLAAKDPTTLGVTEPWIPAFDHHGALTLVPFLLALDAELDAP